jgi:hypothetical protein
MDTLTYTGVLRTVSCWCGIAHAIPDELFGFAQRQRDEGREQTNIYCPLGHKWVFAGEGKVERMQRQLEQSEQRRRATADLLAHEERSHAATKGHLTRTKRRVAHGVCPCCNRTFKQLERHMASQHPEFFAKQNLTPE